MLTTVDAGVSSVTSDQTSTAWLLSGMLADPEITDVLINSTEMWVDRGLGLQRVPADLEGPGQVRRLAQRLASLAGRRLDDATPCVDAQLPDGTRMHAVLPPVARNGPYLSFRTFRPRGFSLDELANRATMSPQIAELLAAIVLARLPYLITGGTGCGKTTLLSAMLSLVPQTERIVVVEEASELRPNHPHVIYLQARTANVEGVGSITLRELVRQALRMRPDRLVVGECRGPEVIDLLCALNTGHEGGAATLHANAPGDVPARLEALGLLAGVSRQTVQAQILAGLRVVIQLRRLPGARVVDEICLVTAAADGSVGIRMVWRRCQGLGPAAQELAELLSVRQVLVPQWLTGLGS